MKVMLDPGAIMPRRAYPTDAGLDFFSREEHIILPGESAVFDTGVHIELPEGTFMKLESKSGLNVKYGVVSHGGVIDQNYRGSIAVKLYNHGDKPYMIKKGQKIIQGIIQPYIAPELELADSLSETDRGSNGFGSTEEMWKDQIDSAPTVSGWINVKDRMPESQRCVLVTVKTRHGKRVVLIACHVNAREVDSEDYGWKDAEIDWDYDEENDIYWVPECWYEGNFVEENTSWIIDEYADGIVTHWMPLPEPPKEGDL